MAAVVVGALDTEDVVARGSVRKREPVKPERMTYGALSYTIRHADVSLTLELMIRGYFDYQQHNTTCNQR